MMNGQWERVLEGLRTEALVARLAGVDPLTLASNPYVAVSALVVVGALCCLRMFRTLAVLAGLIAIWVAVVHTLPNGTEDLHLRDLGAFVGTCVGVIAVWVYVFFILAE